MNSHIVKLQAENIKRLKCVEITPDGNMVIIGGQNAQGKSSVLDSIEYGLRGGKSLPQEPLRRGEDKGYVVIETPDLVIKRTFTKAGNSSLVVSNRQNGLKMTSPQAILDKMAGQLTFDPLEFSRMEARKQAEVLKRLLGIDLSEYTAKRENAFDLRTMASRKEKELTVLMQSMAKYEGVPPEEVSSADLAREMQECMKVNSENEKERSKVALLFSEFSDANARIILIREQIAKLQIDLEESITKAKSIAERGKAQKALVAKLQDRNVSDMTSQLSQIDETNKKVRCNKALEKTSGEYNAVHEQVEALTKEIDTIDEQVDYIMQSAEMPVDGLAFTDDGVTFNGLPFEQCSSAEQLKISVAMGIAMNPELKVLLIRDGSLLDDKSMAMIKAMADASKCQVWMERVGEGKEVSVILEEGEIKHE